MSSRARAIGVGSINPSLGRYVLHGAVGGVIGGVVMGMFEMAAAAFMGMSMWMPVRMIGGILLGQQALEPSYPLMNALLAMMVVHMMLSAMFGAGIGLAVRLTGLTASPAWLAAAATALGVMIWPVNFYLIAPLFGWNWFPEGGEPVYQAIGHGLFGLATGLYLAWATRRSAQA